MMSYKNFLFYELFSNITLEFGRVLDTHRVKATIGKVKLRLRVVKLQTMKGGEVNMEMVDEELTFQEGKRHKGSFLFCVSCIHYLDPIYCLLMAYGMFIVLYNGNYYIILNNTNFVTNKFVVVDQYSNTPLIVYMSRPNSLPNYIQVPNVRYSEG